MYPNLKLQLWKTGVRQNRLAKMLEIDESSLSKMINGFREPSPDLRLRIAEMLGCDAAWLFNPEERPAVAPEEPGTTGLLQKC